MSLTYVPTVAMGVFETLVHIGRRLRLRLYRWAGSIHRRTSRGWGPVTRWLAAVALVLLVLPWGLTKILGLVSEDTWQELTGGDGTVGEWWSVRNVLIVSAVILAVRWLVRARERVVVEEFVDYTNNDAQAVKGLATLLVAELSRLHELYGHVNDQLSTPMSVGVQHRGGAGAGTEPGAFLSVRADDVTGTLNDAIATESKVQVGGITIPIGFVLSLLGRVARGPRIIGSLHYTDALGAPTLTAQIVGRGKGQQWRVDAPAGAQSSDKAFLDPMVTEVACRMFNELTLRGSVRWRAIRAFTEYLELYWESHRTPKDRARNLKQAETSLLQAIAEDETFDLAYYNLGVIYSKLAETEHAAAQASDYVSKSDDPDTAYHARLDAALAAFNRAVTLNRDRTEAIYALAVHEFARIRAGGAADDLDGIVCRCDRVLELDKRHAQAHDLKGMALLALGQPGQAERSHRRAVRLSWHRLRRAEFTERAVPPTTDSALPGARANTAAALHNLAEVHRNRATHNCPRLRLVRADHMYRRAGRLAPTETRAATLLARGRMLDERGKPGKARGCYDAALKIDPENPVHWAHLASAHAAEGDEKKARRLADSALNELAPIYRRTLELHHSKALVAMRDNTLAALARTYDLLDASDDVNRAKRLERAVGHARERDEATNDVAALEALKADRGLRYLWEREQVQIALARTLGRNGLWEQARDEYAELIATLAEHRPQGIVQHSLHAKHARALRRSENYHEALVAAARGQLQDPLSASARREVGKAHFALLQYEEALEAWEHTLWLTPNDPHLHWKVAFCHWSVAQDRRDSGARRDALVAAAAGFEQAATLFGVRIANGLGVVAAVGRPRPVRAGRPRRRDPAPTVGDRVQGDRAGRRGAARRGVPRRGRALAEPRPVRACAGGRSSAGRRAPTSTRTGGRRSPSPTRSGARMPASPCATSTPAITRSTTATATATAGARPAQWRSAADDRVGANALAGLDQARHAEPLRLGEAGVEQLAGALVPGGGLRQHARELDLGARDPRTGAHALVHRERGLEVRDRLLAPAQQVGEQPEVARRRPGARGRPADRHVAVGERLEQLVQRRGVRGVAERRRRFGQVRDRAEPDPVERQGAEVVGRELVDDRARLVRAAGLGEQPGEHAAPAGDRPEPLGVVGGPAPRAAPAGRARAAASATAGAWRCPCSCPGCAARRARPRARPPRPSRSRRRTAAASRGRSARTGRRRAACGWRRSARRRRSRCRRRPCRRARAGRSCASGGPAWRAARRRSARPARAGRSRPPGAPARCPGPTATSGARRARTRARSCRPRGVRSRPPRC